MTEEDARRLVRLVKETPIDPGIRQDCADYFRLDLFLLVLREVRAVLKLSGHLPLLLRLVDITLEVE
jgi:hypothetical protein